MQQDSKIEIAPSLPTNDVLLPHLRQHFLDYQEYYHDPD